MAIYSHSNYSNFFTFIEHLPPEQSDQFQVIKAFQDSLGCRRHCCSICRYDSGRVDSSLAFGISRGVQNTVEDLPFDALKLFAESKDEFLHSRATLRSLEIYTLEALVDPRQHRDPALHHFPLFRDLMKHSKRTHDFRGIGYLFLWCLPLSSHQNLSSSYVELVESLE